MCDASWHPKSPSTLSLKALLSPLFIGATRVSIGGLVWYW